MCSLILRLNAEGVEIAANRDEMRNRLWDPPAEYWPGICGGRDRLAGGTWLAVNRQGVVAGVLNRTGTLGPAADKASRGALPLLALREATAQAAAARIMALDAGDYRPFNMVLANSGSVFFLRGLGSGRAEMRPLPPGLWMVTSGEPNDLALPRIARHLPRFRAAPFAAWGALLGNSSGEREEQLTIPAEQANGFGTVCASLLTLPRDGACAQAFSAGPPDVTQFQPITWGRTDGPAY